MKNVINESEMKATNIAWRAAPRPAQWEYRREMSAPDFWKPRLTRDHYARSLPATACICNCIPFDEADWSIGSFLIGILISSVN